MMSFLKWLNESNEQSELYTILDGLKYINNWISNPGIAYDYRQFSSKINRLGELVGQRPGVGMYIRSLMQSYHTIAELLARFPKPEVSGVSANNSDFADFQRKIQGPYDEYKSSLENINRALNGNRV